MSSNEGESTRVKYDAVLLTSFGGPESPDEVMPFLERVTAGRGVPRERLEEVSHHYLALGGVSPINAQNRALLAEMKRSFSERGVDLPIYWGNRNSQPFYADVLRQMDEDGHRTILALVTSAYSSYSGCRQYRENLAQALITTELDGKLEIHKIRHYFDHPGFVIPFAEGISAAIQELKSQGIAMAETKLFFTTHSIPTSMNETSGPESLRAANPEGMYVAQHLAAARAITSMVGEETPAWELVYQSRSGAPHIPWLEPDIGEAIEKAAANGSKAVILAPIGFISDHVEVVWDLDNEAEEIATGLNLVFRRVATPGTHSEFVSAITDLVLERTSCAERKALSPLGPWRDFCSADCCPNARALLPTVSEL